MCIKIYNIYSLYILTIYLTNQSHKSISQINLTNQSSNNIPLLETGAILLLIS